MLSSADLYPPTEKWGSPLFEKDGQWFFYDETWANTHGPYINRDAAKRALHAYCWETLGTVCQEGWP
ncbi:hypothetical protein [Hyphomicrobium sp. ghe19]|uniref:hypothetical protein n=1 Tax=Hyphomicrobium sp. ghe19 TaxID=2682968 RepID=UPI0013673F3F|nr:hypothetical protein HYPP_02409 [Hyphomicrobium sp. ghe19]